MTGRMRARQSHPPTMAELLGVHLSHNAKTDIKMTAVAISGKEVVTIEMNDVIRSWAEPSFMPAMMPHVSDSGIIRAKTQKPNMPVFLRRSSTSVATGSLVWYDL